MKLNIPSWLVTLLVLAGTAQANSAEQIFTYYDMGKPKTVMLIPDHVAEFGSLDAVMPRTMAGNDPLELGRSAQLTDKGSGAARIWKLGTAVTSGLIQARNSRNTLTRLSPVFLKDGSLRALPGGVIVQFPVDMEEGQARAWLVDRGLVLVEKLSFGNLYQIASPAGMAAMELANELQASDEVLSATPNWWVQTSKR